jgi:hypothetical protein
VIFFPKTVQLNVIDMGWEKEVEHQKPFLFLWRQYYKGIISSLCLLYQDYLEETYPSPLVILVFLSWDRWLFSDYPHGVCHGLIYKVLFKDTLNSSSYLSWPGSLDNVTQIPSVRCSKDKEKKVWSNRISGDFTGSLSFSLNWWQSQFI